MNQRRHVRHVVNPRLYVAMSGSSAGGILHDISDGGVALDVVDSTPSDERVHLDFDMSETGEHFEGLGRVIWRNESASRIGIRFVDLPDSSRNKVRKWLLEKSSARDTLQNMVVQDRVDSSSMESPLRLGERTLTSAVSAVLERPQKEEVVTSAAERPPQNTEVEPVLPSRDKTDQQSFVKDEHPVADSQARSSYRTPRAEPILGLGIPPGDLSRGRSAYSWNDLRRLIVIVATISIAIILVAIGIRVLRTGSTNQSVRSFVANLLNPSAPVRVASPRVSTSGRSRAPQTSGDTITDLNTGKPVTSDQFEVMDAQHGRRYLPRTGTNVVIQADKSQPTPPANGTSHPLDASIAKTGRVSQQFSGELPVVETIPEYPTFALQTNVEGRVVLSAIVGTDGTLHNEHLVSSPSMLDSTVLDAVKKWRYHQHYEHGKPVEVETQITVDFSITTE
jgi:TonB family protein